MHGGISSGRSLSFSILVILLHGFECRRYSREVFGVRWERAWRAVLSIAMLSLSLTRLVKPQPSEA